MLLRFRTTAAASPSPIHWIRMNRFRIYDPNNPKIRSPQNRPCLSHPKSWDLRNCLHPNHPKISNFSTELNVCCTGLPASALIAEYSSQFLALKPTCHCVTFKRLILLLRQSYYGCNNGADPTSWQLRTNPKVKMRIETFRRPIERQAKA